VLILWNHCSQVLTRKKFLRGKKILKRPNSLHESAIELTFENWTCRQNRTLLWNHHTYSSPLNENKNVNLSIHWEIVVFAFVRLWYLLESSGANNTELFNSQKSTGYALYTIDIKNPASADRLNSQESTLSLFHVVNSAFPEFFCQQNFFTMHIQLTFKSLQ